MKPTGSSCLVRQGWFGCLVAVAFLAACGKPDFDATIKSANAALEKQDLQGALIHLRNALAIKPDNALLRFQLGRLLLETGDAAGAEVELRKALEGRHSADEAGPILLRSLYMQGNFKKLIEEAGSISVLSKDAQAEVQATVASAYVALGDKESARKAVAKAMEAQGNNAGVRRVQARLHMLDGEFDKATAVVASIIAADPKDFQAHALAGDIRRVQGDCGKARESFAKSLEINPGQIVVRAAKAFCTLNLVNINKTSPLLKEAESEIAEMGKLRNGQFYAALLEAHMALIKEDYKAGLEAGQRVLRLQPENPTGLLAAGVSSLYLGNFVQAEAHLAQCLRVTPDPATARRYLGLTYLRAGSYRKAVEVLEAGLSKSADDSAMLSMLGDALMQSGDFKRAEQVLNRAVKLEPGNPVRGTALALARLGSGDAAGAFATLEEISKTDKGTTADYAMMAAYVNRRDFDKALRALDRIEAKVPSTVLSRNLRGRILVAKGDNKAAREVFEDVVRKQPGFLPAVSSLAGLDMLAKDAPAAQRRLQQYVDANPKSSEAWLLLAQTRQDVKAPAQEVAGLIEKAVLADPVSKEARLALANFWFEQREYGKAASAAQEALARLPDSPEFLEVLGRSFRGSGDTNQAQATYLKWASMRPSDPEPLFRAAEIMVSVKDMEGAARTLRKAVEIKPEYVPAQQGLARLNLLSGRGDEARAIARQVQAQKSTQGAGYTIEGDIEAASKNWSEAITAYRKGLKVAASTNLAIKLYSVLVTSKQTHEAEQFAASWLKDYPGDLVFRLYLSESLLVRGDFADAEKQMLTILEKRPEDAGVLNNLAYVSMRLKRPKAVEYAERAVKLEPGKAAFIDTLGMVLADSGQTGRAVEVLSRAVQLAPDDHGIRFNYAKALVADGKKDAARRELEVLAKLGNKFPAQADVTKLQASL